MGWELRLALCQSSIFSLQADFPVAIVAALVDRGLWPAARAIGHARQIEQPEERLITLKMLADRTTDPAAAVAILREAAQALPDVGAGTEAYWHRVTLAGDLGRLGFFDDAALARWRSLSCTRTSRSRSSWG